MVRDAIITIGTPNPLRLDVLAVINYILDFLEELIVIIYLEEEIPEAEPEFIEESVIASMGRKVGTGNPRA